MNLAYAAGIFDGEGCVNFTRCRTTHSIRILIVNTNLSLLEDFKAEWGGDIGPLTKRKANWKIAYTWRLSNSRAIAFLNSIEPWLRIKWKQAVVAFAWDAIRPGRGKKRIDSESSVLLRAQLSWLNHRGLQNNPEPIAIAMSKAGKSRKK